MIHPNIAVPAGWGIEPIEHEGVNGLVIRTPRINGMRSNTCIWADSDDPAHAFLMALLDAPENGLTRIDAKTAMDMLDNPAEPNQALVDLLKLK